MQIHFNIIIYQRVLKGSLKVEYKIIYEKKNSRFVKIYNSFNLICKIKKQK